MYRSRAPRALVTCNRGLCFRSSSVAVGPDFNIPTVTVDDIRDHFIQRWPHISPLAKGSCLDVDPI
jgi:hypothetical protein